MTEAKSHPQFCPHCNGTREQCEDNEYCQYRWPGPAQPQLPPLSAETQAIFKQAEEHCAGTLWQLAYQEEVRERKEQLLSALAENESLKAELKDANFQHETYQKVATDAAFALGIAPDPETKEWVNVRAMDAEKEGRKYLVERDQALEVVREYRGSKGHEDCFSLIGLVLNETEIDDRCPTCIKADAILKDKA